MGETAAREEGEREKGELVIVSYARRGRKEKFIVGKHEWCILHDMSMDDGWRVGAVVLCCSPRLSLLLANSRRRVREGRRAAQAVVPCLPLSSPQ